MSQNKSKQSKSEVTSQDPDLKDITVEFDNAQKKPKEGIHLSISHVSKFKQILLKQQSNRLHNSAIGLQNGEKIKIQKCTNVFYNTGQVYHEETDSHSGSIAKYQAILWANVENEACVVLKDKKENYYVFTLNKYLIKSDILLNSNLGSNHGVTNIEIVPMGEDMTIDRIITNDKLQLVSGENLFVTDNIT